MLKTTIAIILLTLSGLSLCFGEMVSTDAGVPTDEKALNLDNSIKEIKAYIFSVATLSRQTEKKVDLLNARLVSDSVQREDADIVEKLNRLNESFAGLQDEMTTRFEEISRWADLKNAETRKSNSAAFLFLIVITAGFISGMALLGIAMVSGFRKLSRAITQLEKNKNLIVLPQSRPKETRPAVDHTLACVLARELFRMKARIGQPGSNGESMSRAIKRLEDELDSRGYTVRNLDGQPYRTGMIVQVMNFIVTPGVTAGQERVARTVRPEICWKGSVIDPGAVEVMVGEETKAQQPNSYKTEAAYVSQNH